MNVAAWPSCPTQAAAPRWAAPRSAGTVFSISAPSTSATSYRPASISAIAPSTAIEPEAQAASCRTAGTPHSAGSTVAGMPPSCPWPVNNCPKALPTWMTSTSVGAIWAAARVCSTDSANSSANDAPSRAVLRAKSVW